MGERGEQAMSESISQGMNLPEVMRQAVIAGASIINDIAALQVPGALDAAAAGKAAVVLMHMQGTPQTMQENPVYVDVVRAVEDFFRERLQRLNACGVGADQVVFDVGIGFGKTSAHNLRLLTHLPALAAECGRPVVVGLSRKRFIGEITGRDAHDRLAKPSYDLQAIGRNFAFLDAMRQTLTALGFGLQQIDHEDAHGQYEVNFAYEEALASCDHLMLFKLAAQALAEARGMVFSMMPKPFANQPGSGMHFHQMLPELREPRLHRH